MRRPEGSAGLGLALLSGFLLACAGCLPAWARRPPTVTWTGDAVTAEAPGQAEHVSFPLSCDLARKKAEKAALEAAADAWARRYGTRQATLPMPVFDLVGQDRPAADSCFVLIRLTARPAPPAK